MISTNERKYINAVLVGLLILISVSRGLLEIKLSKSSAYILQVVTILGVIFYITKFSIIKEIFLNIKYQILLLITLFCCILTYFNLNTFGYLWLIIVIFYLLNIEFVKYLKFNKLYNKDILQISLICIFILVTAFGVFQENKLLLDYLPIDNSHLHRPSSITSSYLHYPIALSIISIIFLKIWADNPSKKIFFILYIVGFCIVITTYSRYGMLQVLLGALLINNKKIILILISLILIMYIIDPSTIIRLFGAISPHSLGNSDRISTWIIAFENLEPNNLFLGNNFGIYSNSFLLVNNKIISSINNLGVTESSLLLLFLNFGIIGGLYFLYINYLNYRNNIKYYLILLIPSIFYQSVEVIPFIVLFSMAPLFFNSNENNIR